MKLYAIKRDDKYLSYGVVKKMPCAFFVADKRKARLFGYKEAQRQITLFYSNDCKVEEVDVDISEILEVARKEIRNVK